jgi:hypothetical protein
MDNNPNMIDSLFTPHDCVRHITKIGQMVRDSRKLFLHKGSWHKFRGYSYSNLAKLSTKHKKSDSLDAVMQFEKTHNIPSSITLPDIELEMKCRGMT